MEELNDKNLLIALSYFYLTKDNLMDPQFRVDTNYIIKIITESPAASFGVLKDKHSLLDAEKKLLLLKSFVHVEDLLEHYLKFLSYRSGTNAELEIIIPKVINDHTKLIPKLIESLEKKDKNTEKFINKLKIDKSIKESLISHIVAFKLS